MDAAGMLLGYMDASGNVQLIPNMPSVGGRGEAVPILSPGSGGGGGAATVLADNLTTASAAQGLTAHMGNVLANANPDPFLGMTSDQIRASALNVSAYFNGYTVDTAAAAHNAPKDAAFSYSPIAANAAWALANPGNPAQANADPLTASIWFDNSGKIIQVTKWI